MITKLHSQQDSRWAGELLGNNTDANFNIGRYGCVITAYGNMLCAITGDMQYTPEFINNWMKSHNGFMPTGGLFIWNAALALGHVEARGITANLGELSNWLQDGPNFAILEVRAGNGMQHFVMAPYVDKIVDSADGLLKSMSTYPFVNAHLYRSIDSVNHPPVPAPLPTPIKKSGTVTVTATPFLNLRTGPGTNFPIGKGSDGNGHTIYNLPTGAVVGYVDVVQADPNSAVQGPWLVSSKGKHFAASGTNY